MKRIIALLGILFALSAVTVVSSPTPVQASVSVVSSANVQAPTAVKKELNCEPNGVTHLFCLYRSWDYTLNQPAVWSEGFFDSNPRNTCLVVATADDASWFNDTRFVWFRFNTTLCDGTHYTSYPHTAAQVFPTGRIHAVMRTALLG